MNKHIVFTIIALTAFGYASAQEATTISAAIPVYTERFDWATGSGGNDGNWTSKYMNTVLGDHGIARYYSTTEANGCVCVGTLSSEGRVTIDLSGIPSSDGFVSLRAGAYLNDDKDNAKVVMKNLISSEATVRPGRFYNVRKTFYRTESNRSLVITGDYNDDNYRYYLDDITVYATTTDVEELKTASRIILNAYTTYTPAQIRLLQEIVSQNENLTSIDLWSPTISETFELRPANPNCIIYDPNNYVTNTVNVARCSGTSKDINTYVCENLKVYDGYPFDAMFSFTATNVSYDREFANTGADYFSTLCLPFTVSKTSTGVEKLLQFVRYEPANGHIVCDESNVIIANTPYVVSVREKQPFLDMNNVNAEVSASTPRTVWETVDDGAPDAEKERAKACRFSGTCKRLTGVSSNSMRNIYGFSSGRFVKVDGGCTFNPFRAYIAIDTDNANMDSKELNLATSNGWVGIDNASTNCAKQGETIVYTTDGALIHKAKTYNQAVCGLAKGLYIINGKKTIIK